MRSQRRKSKGIALTAGSILEALFFIGIVGLGFWFLLDRIVDIHMSVVSADMERHAINLANVLLSYENLAYIEDGKIQRGVLDSRKLESFSGVRFASTQMDPKSANFDKEKIKQLFDNYKQIDFAYPNSINFVFIVDLESCENGCPVWSTIIVGPMNLKEHPIIKFRQCLYEEFISELGDASAWTRRLSGCGAGATGGAIVGSIVPGIGTAIGAAIGCGIGVISFWWDWNDIYNCGVNAVPEQIKYVFSSGSFASAQGLPILIRYPDGTTHAARIMVSVVEFS